MLVHCKALFHLEMWAYPVGLRMVIRVAIFWKQILAIMAQNVLQKINGSVFFLLSAEDGLFQENHSGTERAIAGRGVHRADVPACRKIFVPKRRRFAFAGIRVKVY